MSFGCPTEDWLPIEACPAGNRYVWRASGSCVMFIVSPQTRSNEIHELANRARSIEHWSSFGACRHAALQLSFIYSFCQIVSVVRGRYKLHSSCNRANCCDTDSRPRVDAAESIDWRALGMQRSQLIEIDFCQQLNEPEPSFTRLNE